MRIVLLLVGLFGLVGFAADARADRAALADAFTKVGNSAAALAKTAKGWAFKSGCVNQN